jgi:hypothetical protein
MGLSQPAGWPTRIRGKHWAAMPTGGSNHSPGARGMQWPKSGCSDPHFYVAHRPPGGRLCMGIMRSSFKRTTGRGPDGKSAVVPLGGAVAGMTGLSQYRLRDGKGRRRSKPNRQQRNASCFAGYRAHSSGRIAEAGGTRQRSSHGNSTRWFEAPHSFGGWPALPSSCWARNTLSACERNNPLAARTDQFGRPHGVQQVRVTSPSYF